ncbi:O-antigen ligase family protein [Desulfococcaceae bacterium HSG9]|nr:O-antigen ligase family protein [Desulfococcaceae bacterium HSG9]
MERKNFTPTKDPPLGIAFILTCIFTLANYISLRYYYPWLFNRIPFFVGVTALLIHIVECIAKNRKFFYLTPPFFCLLVVFFLVFITSRTSLIDPQTSQEVVSAYLIAVIVFYLISFTINSLKELKLYLVTLSLGAYHVVNRMVNHAYYFRARPFIRGSTLASDPNDVAMIIVYSFPIIFALLLTCKRKIYYPCFLYLFRLMVIATVQTLSRGAIVATLGMFINFIKEAPRDKKFLLCVLLMIGFTLSLFVLPNTFFDRMSSITDPEKDETGSAGERKKNMIGAWNYMITAPISEYGPGNNGYMLAIQKGQDPSLVDIFHGNHVHCAYLEIGADVGLIAFIFFMLFFFTLFRSLKNAEKQIAQSEKKGILLPINRKKDMIIYIKLLRSSLIGLMIAAVFLPISYRLYLYYIGGTIVALERVVLNEVAAAESEAQKET